MNWKSIRSKLIYIPSILIFVMTLFLIHTCISGGFAGLIYAKYYITVVILWFFFSIFFICWLTSFAVLLFDDPGSMKLELINNNYEDERQHCKILCPKCGGLKPFRTHHCSTCNCCFACMDHHCSVFGRCIALRNKKIFIQYFVYAIGMLLIYAGTSLASIFINEFDSFPFFLAFNVLVGVSLSFLLGVFLFQQLSSAFKGKTTIELLYDVRFEDGLTKYERFQQVFGPPSIDWLIPRPLRYEFANPFQWEKYRTMNHEKDD